VLNNRNIVWSAVGVAVVMFGLAPVQRVAAGTAEKSTYLTFSGSVRLPGVTLSPGTYAFELRDPLDSAGIVQVRSRDGRTTYFMGFTDATERSRGRRLEATVTLGESAAGMAPPITAWWATGELTGRKFIYPNR
jgi:hypothetical protein